VASRKVSAKGREYCARNRFGRSFAQAGGITMKIIAVIGLLFATTSNAAAQKSDIEGKPGQCFEVLMAPRGGTNVLSTDPASSILLNKCTGDTWMLVRTTVSKPGKPEEFAYRWYPISAGSSEAVISRGF
jgi:hypothetical protein